MPDRYLFWIFSRLSTRGCRCYRQFFVFAFRSHQSYLSTNPRAYHLIAPRCIARWHSVVFLHAQSRFATRKSRCLVLVDVCEAADEVKLAREESFALLAEIAISKSELNR
jgi:hypothetical protein